MAYYELWWWRHTAPWWRHTAPNRYIVSHSVDDRVDACLLSAQLFKALFHASLPHPASDYEYVNYEIGQLRSIV